MPKLSSNSVRIQNGSIVLSKRPKSPFWQARFRIGRKWIRTSTKTADLDDATDFAINLQARAEIKAEMGLAVVSRKFKSIALAVRDQLRLKLESGEGKIVYRDYIQVIDNYLIPFFGNHYVGNINYALVREFSEYRKGKLGREPAKSTLNTHAAALSRIFREAVNQDYMPESQVPSLRIDRREGAKCIRRPVFSIDEYRQLYRFMRSWVKQGRSGKSSDMRYLLRDYVLFLANSGIRPGTEAYNLKWKHLQFRKDAELATKVFGGSVASARDEFLVIWVSGKTEARELIPRAHSIKYLQRILERSNSLQGKSLTDAMKSDEYVFCLPDGTRTKQLVRKFAQLLRDAKLLTCPRTSQPRTLYSLRHFYITQAIINSRATLHTISKQCGTSVGMLEKHYSHLEVWDKRWELAR